MAQETMYSGLVNSPETTITNNINTSDTLIYVLDPARVPSDLPNLMTIGTGTNAETVLVESINNSAITVQRGFQGVAKDWPAGTIIARNFTEYDHAAFKSNIEDLDTRVGPLANLLTTIKTSVVNAINSLKGEFTAHLAETMSKAVLIDEPVGQTTTTTVTLGFKPKTINIKTIIIGQNFMSDGVCDESLAQYCQYAKVTAVTTDIRGYAVDLQDNAGEVLGTIANITNTTFDIQWSVTGTPPGTTRRIAVLATTH